MPLDSDPRQRVIDDFLSAHDWADAQRQPLGQDASTRSYVRLVRPGGASAMLMDAPGVEDPPCPPRADEETRQALGWNATTRLAASRVDAFVALAGALRRNGLSAPDIIAADAGSGLALLEDFGAGREFARLIERGEAGEVELYAAAGDLLGRLQALPAPDLAQGYGQTWPVLDFDSLALRTNANLFAEWMPQFDERVRWGAAAGARWAETRDQLIAAAMGFPRVFTLRDYHAENLVWLPERQHAARVGLLDFQDAVRGWAGWDLAMLTQDARRPVSPEARRAAIDAVLYHASLARAELDEQLAVIGTLNALRIAGLFARLIMRDRKPRYHAFLPRQLDILSENLQHPAVEGMARFMGEVAPHILDRTR